MRKNNQAYEVPVAKKAVAYDDKAAPFPAPGRAFSFPQFDGNLVLPNGIPVCVACI